MHTYLRIQESELGNGTLPWPVSADRDGKVVVPSSILMARVVGFQRDLAVMQIDTSWDEAFTNPSAVIGMHVVSQFHDGAWKVGTSAIATAEIMETEHEIPVER